MDYKEYNKFLNRPARVIGRKNKDYEAVDQAWKEIRIILIITFIFSLFIVNWGNHIVERIGL